MSELSIADARTIVFKAIADADSIVVFGHKNPDGDCLGSVLGLKRAILHFYPGKKVYADISHPSYLPQDLDPSDTVSDETIQNSLAVMIDLSELDRVEDQRIRIAKNVVAIDHHIASHPADFPVLRDASAASATVVLTESLLALFHEIPKECANYLFLGLITDSGRFQFDSRPETLRIGAQLVEAGADYLHLYRDLYQQTSIDLKYRSYVYQNFAFEGSVTYCCVSKAAYTGLGMDQNSASGKVNLISMLDNHPIWAFFVEQDDGGIRVELRSDGTYDVHLAAMAFGGGGHLAASGCRIASFDQVKDVLKTLNELPKIA